MHICAAIMFKDKGWATITIVGLSHAGTTKDGLDDSARGTIDVEKAAAKTDGSSARGSAQFLAEVESMRSIKVHCSRSC